MTTHVMPKCAFRREISALGPRNDVAAVSALSETSPGVRGWRLDAMLQKTTLGIVFSITACVATGIYAYWPASLLSSTRLVGGGIGDSAGQVNAMSWTPYAISHGLNLFFTNVMNYPEGFNLASNAFFPLIGIIAWPITATLGSIPAVNFGFVLAFVASATAMFVVLWQITRFLPGAFLGGLLYGFSPYMVGQGLGHLAILFQPIPPIVLFLLLKLLGDTRRSGCSVGIALGIAVGLQAYIAIEVIATMALVAVIAVVLVGIMRWRELRPHISRILVGLTWAIGTFAVIAGYPLATCSSALGTCQALRNPYSPLIRTESTCSVRSFPRSSRDSLRLISRRSARAMQSATSPRMASTSAFHCL